MDDLVVPAAGEGVTFVKHVEGEDMDDLVVRAGAKRSSLLLETVDSSSSKKNKDAYWHALVDRKDGDGPTMIPKSKQSIISVRLVSPRPTEYTKTEQVDPYMACLYALFADNVELVRKYAPMYLASRIQSGKIGPIPPFLADPVIWNITKSTMSSAQVREARDARNGFPLFSEPSALQLFSVRIMYVDPDLIRADGRVRFYGSIRARDIIDRKRNILFDIPADAPISVLPGEALPLSGPCRSIHLEFDFDPEIQLEFDLKALPATTGKGGGRAGDSVQLIADVCGTELGMLYEPGRPQSCSVFGKHGIAKIYYCALVDVAEASLEIHSTASPESGGSARIGRIRIVARYVLKRSKDQAKQYADKINEEEIVLFDGTLDEEEKQLPVLVVPRRAELEIQVQPEGFKLVSSRFSPFAGQEESAGAASETWELSLDGGGPIVHATLHWCSLTSPYVLYDDGDDDSDGMDDPNHQG